MTLISYDEENLKKVSEVNETNLTPDIKHKKWKKRNSITPMFGHCHTASACLQKIFGTKQIKLYRAVDFSETYHWWAKDNYEKVIDLTADQYYSIGEKPPYESGEKKSSLGWGYRKKVDTLFERVERTLNGSNIEQYMGEKNGK